ncbi:MAG: hypothetical protein SGJ10_01250 [Bacteroidota bacterium]|nr:hypothetical protein [Bacteroidota bacterium]
MARFILILLLAIPFWGWGQTREMTPERYNDDAKKYKIKRESIYQEKSFKSIKEYDIIPILNLK